MNAQPLTAEHARAVRVPTLPVLAGIVLVAASVHAALALRSPSPWIVPDELIYAELANSLAEGGLPRIRGEVSFEYGLGYPLLLAPIWALFEHVPTAYAVAKVWNALLMSLAAVPAYFLARRFVDERLALVVAGLTVAVPSLLYAGTLMTEVALYPAFVAALLAATWALECPTWKRHLVVVGAVAVAFSVKTLAVVLVPAYVAALAIDAALESRSLEPSSRRRDRRALAYPLACAVLATLLVLGVLAPETAGILGAYEAVIQRVQPENIPRWFVWHAAELDLFTAVVPFGATLLLIRAGLRKGASPRVRRFAALSASTSLVLFGAVAAYSSNPEPGAGGYQSGALGNERATFIVGPLFFIGLMLWVQNRPSERRWVLVAAGVSALLPALIPLGAFSVNVRFQALALVPWVAVNRAIPWLAIALPLCLLLALVFVHASLRPVSPVVPVAIVLAVFLLVGWAAHGPMRWASEWTSRQAWGERPDWVDAAVGSSAVVSALWYEPREEPFVPPASRHRVLWIGELFNRSLGEVYEIGSPTAYALPATPVRVGAGGVVVLRGKPLELGSLVFAPCHVRPDGDVVAIDRQTGAAVYRVDRPLRGTVSDPSGCGSGVR